MEELARFPLLLAEENGAGLDGGDPSWTWWVLLAAASGVFAGFQGIYQRYGEESLHLCYRLWGLLYLFSRALIPAGLFLFARNSWGEELSMPVLAVCLGAGSEAVLRLKFFVKQKENEDGSVEDLLIGPFNLLRWYQDWFLTQMGPSRWAIQRKSAKKLIPDNLSFDELIGRIETNLLLATKRVQELVQPIIDTAKSEDEDDMQMAQLAFRLRHILSHRETKELFAV